jgi:predicted Zn-dependent protease
VAIQLARSLLALQRPTEALAVTHAINGTGDAGMLLRVLEASALRIAGRVPEAARLVQGVQGTRPGTAVLIAAEVELAACHLDAGDTDAAHKQLTTALARDPKHPPAMRLLARLPTSTPRP